MSHIALEDIATGSVRVVGMVLDDLGNLWLASRDHGVAAVPTVDLLAAMGDASKRPRLSWFDATSGLGSKGGSFVSECIRKSPDGRIWVATARGLSVIHPKLWEAERKRASPPRVYMESCAADGNPLDITPTIRVPPGTRLVDVHFAALSYGFPGEVSYRHRLRGLSDGWVDDEHHGLASFQRLPPGDYRFEAVAANRYGIWSGEPASIALRVLPRWWERPLVRIAGGLALVLAVALMVRARMDALRSRSRIQAEFSRQLIDSQERERGRIARELHDSLGQSLLVVRNLAVMGRLVGAPDSTSRERFDEIAGASSEAIEEVRAISRALRPPELDRLGLTEAIHATIERMSDSSGIPITAEVDDLHGCLPADDEIGLFRILQETLSNVIKHAEATSAAVKIRREAGMLILTVSDNGHGFDSRSQAPGVGLRSISERAQLMGGRWEIHARPGAGTRVQVSIPMRRNC